MKKVNEVYVIIPRKNILIQFKEIISLKKAV